MAAYTLSDRGTWLSFHNKGPLIVVIEGDPALTCAATVTRISDRARLRTAESRIVAGRFPRERRDRARSRVKSRLCDIGMRRCRGRGAALLGFLCLPRPAPPASERDEDARDRDITARPQSSWPL